MDGFATMAGECGATAGTTGVGEANGNRGGAGVTTAESGRGRGESPAFLNNCAASCGIGNRHKKYRPNAQAVITALRYRAKCFSQVAKRRPKVAAESGSKSASWRLGGGELSGDGDMTGASSCFITVLAYSKKVGQSDPWSTAVNADKAIGKVHQSGRI